MHLNIEHTFSVLTAPTHILGPGNVSLHANVRKSSREEQPLFPFTSSSPPGCSDRAPSASSDSGLSVGSQGWTGARQRRGAAQDKGTQAGKLVSGIHFELAQPLLEVMTELAASSRGEGEMTGDDSSHSVYGEVSSSQRETDILEDEDLAAPGADMPSSSSICSLSSENLPEAEYSTHSWVQQQQQIDTLTDNYHAVNGKKMSNGVRKEPLVVGPDAPARGVSSREAVQRGLLDEDCTHSVTQNNTQPAQTAQEEELASLATDIDDSIEQLNQLILDLDPTFVPVPTRCSPLSRSASLHTNGLSHMGAAHQSGKNMIRLR